MPPPGLEPDAPAGGEEMPAPPVPFTVIAGQRIAVLLSGEDPEHQDILQGIVGGLADAGYLPGGTLAIDFFRVEDEAFRPELLSQGGYALVIAVGRQAAQAAGAQLAGSLPLVISGAGGPSAPGDGVTGVDSAVPAEEIINCVLTMQPEARAIGFLYTGSAAQLEPLSQAAAARGISVYSAAAADPGQYAQAGSRLLESAGLLILGQEPGQPEALEQLIRSAQAMGKPVYGFRNTHLLMGCAAACIPDPGAMGSQSGLLAARLLSGEDISALPCERPGLYQIFYNPLVLEKLNITPPCGTMPMLF